MANEFSNALRMQSNQLNMLRGVYASDAGAAEIDRLNHELKVAEAVKAGLRAQGLAFKEALAKVDPNNVLLQNTTVKFEDGRIKTQAQIIFEAAFDKKAKEGGLKNPAKLRIN